MLKPPRVIFWLILTTAVAAAVSGAWLLASSQGRALWAQANEHSPQEVIRYLKRRLEGHPKLETVLLPPLHAAQRYVEREPPPGPLPTLGKGQQAQPPPPVRGLADTLLVDTPQGLRNALLKAGPGTQIVIAPGLYPFAQKLRLGQDGRLDEPIALRAEQPGTVWLEFAQVEGVLVDRPHWIFENLHIRGMCSNHSDCEHAFHVVGRAQKTVIRNNHIIDFNAHIKVNGLNGDWPDHGQLAFNTLTNTNVRDTHNPVVPLDLVGASHWQVTDNLVTHFVKRNGNQVSYGLFMKGGGEGGRIERNLVVCTPSGISQPGARVGISFGGGTTDPSSCRVGGCQTGEHFGGVAANNVVAHCNDVGLDVNRSRDIALLHNTLINTAGIGVRHALAKVEANGNLLEGRVRVRDGANLNDSANASLDPGRHMKDADRLDLRWIQILHAVPMPEGLGADFEGKPRSATDAPGALRLP